jgi:hypothetical protein
VDAGEAVAGGGGGGWAVGRECWPKRGGRAGRGEGMPAQERGEGRPRARLGRGGGARQAGRQKEKRGKGRVWFFSSYFPFLIYFLICVLALVLHRNACFTNSLNKQNICMVRHDATTKRINPRVYLHKMAS